MPMSLPEMLVTSGVLTEEQRDKAQKQAQEQLAKLVSNAKHITNTKSGHDVHKEQPQLVIDSIRKVVDAVHDPASWP